MATDLEIRNQGFKYIPQQQYLLNPFQLPTAQGEETGSIGSMSGITNTRAAGPYMGYPSYAAWLGAQGGGGAGDGGGGDDEDEGYAGLGMSPGALGGKTPGFTGWKDRTLGELSYAYSKVPSFSKVLGWAGNKFKGWSKKQKEKKEARKEMKEQLDAYSGPTNVRDFNPNITGTKDFDPSQGNVTTNNTGYQQKDGSHHPDGGGGNWGMGPGAQFRKDGGIVGLAQGGRIGYEEAGPVIDEETMGMIVDMNNRGMDISTISTLTDTPVETITSILSSLTQEADGGRIRFFYGGLASIL